MMIKNLIQPRPLAIKKRTNHPRYSQTSSIAIQLSDLSNPAYAQGLKIAVTFLPPFLKPLILFIFIQSILFSSLAFSSNTLPNILNNHPSPYLAMHGSDPIHWQEWSSLVLDSAKRQNKPIFISSGYFSCHWCHVMQKENYLNQQTADLINQHFIAVKIDRELNPALDNTLIEFAKKATGLAGWPQHVILTPEGYPFAAFIYLPNKDLNTRLQNIISAWQQEPNKIRQLAINSVDKPQQPKINPINSSDFEDQLIKALYKQKDEFSGGLTGTSKFPEAPLLQSLLAINNLPTEIEDWLLLTLDQMQSQHLFDHIHGGFYRYTVDPEWQTPHFEKMNYSSALLADVYLQAGQRFNRTDYLKTAVETLNYLETHLYNPTTLLYQSSQSAIDSDNSEGGDYLWSKQNLKKALSSEEYDLVKQAWSLHSPPPYDLGWHPKDISINLEKKSFSKSQLLWPSIRHKLQTDPEQIPIDSKSILGWNGLILSAYTRAYSVLQNPKYLDKARALAKRLSNLISQNKPPRALSKLGSLMGTANLQDYAYIYQGLKNLQTIENSPLNNGAILQLETRILRQFYSASGWQYDATPLLPGQQNEWQIPDSAIPSPAAIVSCLNKDILAYAGKSIMQKPVEYASYLLALQQCGKTKQDNQEVTN